MSPTVGWTRPKTTACWCPVHVPHRHGQPPAAIGLMPIALDDALASRLTCIVCCEPLAFAAHSVRKNGRYAA